MRAYRSLRVKITKTPGGGVLGFHFSRGCRLCRSVACSGISVCSLGDRNLRAEGLLSNGVAPAGVSGLLVCLWVFAGVLLGANDLFVGQLARWTCRFARTAARQCCVHLSIQSEMTRRSARSVCGAARPLTDETRSAVHPTRCLECVALLV